MTSTHVVDTGVFAAIGGPSNERYRRVRTFALRNELTFVVPERVYDELTVSASATPPIDVALEGGWVRTADPLEYAIPLVSRTMDGVRRHIANADGRPADEVERADAALAGVVAQLLSSGEVTRAYVYTTDVAAGNAVEAVFESEGYGDSVTYVDGFRFIEDLLEGGAPMDCGR